MNTSHTPMPAARQRAYSGQARSYDRDTGVFQSYRRQLVEALPLDRGQVVLDVGCGTGLCSGLLRDKVGLRGGVVGIEESPQMAAVACERIALEGWRNVTVVQSPAEDARITPAADAALFCAVHDILQSPGALRNVLARLRPGAWVAAGGGQWAAPALMGMNLLISMLHAPYVGSFSGFSRPWRHLEQLVEDVQVREMGFGSGYIMAGGLIHAPGHLPARPRGHRGQHRDPPRPVNKLSAAGPATAYPPVVTVQDLARRRGKYAHLNLSSTEPRCLGQAGGTRAGRDPARHW